MTNRSVTIQIDLDRLEQEKAQLEAKIAELERQLATVRRKIEVAPLFMNEAAEKNGHVVVQPQTALLEVKGGEPSIKDADVPLPQAILALMRTKGPLTTIQIRDSLISGGFPRAKLGATYSYLYTVLGRLVASKRLERAGDKYRLPRGAMLALVPDEAATTG